MAPELLEPDNPNMTPMIDVVFQLLIFFMLVTDMTRQQNAPVKLPGATKATQDPPENGLMVLTVRADGTMLEGGRVVFRPPDPGRPAQARALDALFENRLLIPRYREDGPLGIVTARYPVLIRADRGADFQWVQLALASATERGGVVKVQLGARIPPKGAR